jgi:hypothetical protein
MYYLKIYKIPIYYKLSTYLHVLTYNINNTTDVHKGKYYSKIGNI